MYIVCECIQEGRKECAVRSVGYNIMSGRAGEIEKLIKVDRQKGRIIQSEKGKLEARQTE